MKTMGALLWEPGTRSGWSVEEINQGYTDMLEGLNIRGLIVYD